MSAPTLSVPTLRRTGLDSADGLSWSVRALTAVSERWAAAAGPVPATVPGEVVADLLAAGAIPDPYDGANETDLHWIGRTDWEFSTTFTFHPEGEARHDLVAAGLDTVATLRLNGVEIGRTANQHRSYRFDVAALLRDGDNELVISFEGPVSAAERLSAEIGERPRAYGHPFNAVRKMAAGYGWDWGIDIAGVGIWKSIGIESWSEVRLAGVRPLALLDGDDGLLEAHVELEWAPDAASESIELSLEIGGAAVHQTVECGSDQVVLAARLPQVQRWWPAGHGAQHRYPVAITLADQHWHRRVGFRTAELAVEPDGHGTGFAVVINGEPVYVKGMNWIPDDALLTRLDAASYRRSLIHAAEAGVNLLRVWGGGIYESEDFYEVCDELGLLVWQDFLFACAAYAEEEPLRSEIEAEAREAVSRLSSHPSLAVWNGNNENIWGYVAWGWRAQLRDGSDRPDGEELSWGEGYYLDLLPGIVAELDPRTPYSPGSPYSFSRYLHPNDDDHGTSHLWDVWNQVDYRHYRDHRSRFVSEFGFQGPPAYSTLTSAVHDQPLDPYGPQLLVHQKAADGNLKLERGLGEHLPVWDPDSATMFDDWHWLTSLNQARAVAYGIEHLRSLHPLNTGAIVWQLNDNWPVVSWAAVDYAEIRKPLWYAIRRSYADRLLTFQPRTVEGDDQLALVAHNDSAEPWQAELVLTRRGTGTGTPVLAEQRMPLVVEPRSTTTVVLMPELRTADDPTAELLVATADGAAEAHGYLVEDTRLQLCEPEIALEVSSTPDTDGYAVTATASALVKDLMLFPDRLDPAARVDSGLITLLAGQSHTFVVTGSGLDEASLLTRPGLRSVNDLVGRGQAD